MGWDGTLHGIEEILSIMSADAAALYAHQQKGLPLPRADTKKYVRLTGTSYEAFAPVASSLLLPQGDIKGLVVGSRWDGCEHPIVTYSANVPCHVLLELDRRVLAAARAHQAAVALIYEREEPTSTLLINRIRLARTKESL